MSSLQRPHTALGKMNEIHPIREGRTDPTLEVNPLEVLDTRELHSQMAWNWSPWYLGNLPKTDEVKLDQPFSVWKNAMKMAKATRDCGKVLWSKTLYFSLT